MPQTLAEIIRLYHELKKDVDCHEIDLYKGKGPRDPSITLRLANVEKTVADIRKLGWIIVTALIALGLEIFFKK